jgi:hypothetical protein
MLAIEGDKFRNIISGMGRMYGAEPDGLVLDAYWIALCDWEFQHFQAAAQRLMKTSKFMPRPSDFEDLRKAGRPTAAEAFAKAITWARSGIYTAPAKTPEAILIDRVVASLGGWIAITSYDQEKLHFLEKRFVENYEMIQDATDTREALPQITLHAPDLTPRLAADVKRLTNGFRRIGAPQPALEAK